MAQWYNIKTDFTAGQLSPLLYARQDADIYNKGVAALQNGLPLVQGAVTRREGTEYIREVVDGSGNPVTNARLFSFQRGAQETYLGVMGGGKIRIYSDETFTIREELVKNNNFSEGLNSWNVINTSVTPPFPFTKPQTPLGWGFAAKGEYIEGYDPDDQMARIDTLDQFEYTVSGSLPSIEYPIWYAGTSTALEQTVNVVEPNDQFRLYYKLMLGEVKGNDLAIAAARFKVSISAVQMGDDELHSQTFSSANPLPVNDFYEFEESVSFGSSGFTGNVYVQVRWYMDPSYDKDVGFLVDARCYGVSLQVDRNILPSDIPELTVPYTDDQLDAIQYVQNPYERQTVFVHPDVPVQELVLSSSAVWSFNAVTYEGTPPNFGGTTNYPRACGSFQGKLLLGGSSDRPQTVWGSESGNWRNLEVPSGTGTITAADPIEFTMNDVGIIQWIAGQKSMLIGTSEGEYAIASQSGLLQAGDIDVRQQSAYGSAHIQVAPIGDQVVFVSADRRVVRAMAYNENIQGWDSPDLTFISENITAGGVKRIIYLREPRPVIWCPLMNGDMVACSYERNFQLIGWSRQITSGQILDVTKLRTKSGNAPIILVRRSINNTSKIYIEAIGSVHTSNYPHLDSAVTFTATSATTTVTGLGHLEGLTVGVIADSKIVNNKVVASGEITLDTAATSAHVGLNYTTSISTLPINWRQTGGGLGGKKSNPVIGVRLLQSGQPMINNQRIAANTDTNPVAANITNFSGDVEIFRSETDELGQITFSENTARPLTIIGVFGKISSSSF